MHNQVLRLAYSCLPLSVDMPRGFFDCRGSNPLPKLNYSILSRSGPILAPHIRGLIAVQVTAELQVQQQANWSRTQYPDHNRADASPPGQLSKHLRSMS